MPFNPCHGELVLPYFGTIRQNRCVALPGADVSLFDNAVAFRASLETAQGQRIVIGSVSGHHMEARLLEVELHLLDEPELSIVVPVGFGAISDNGIGNLIGLDGLEHFDFAPTHSQRIGCLGRSAP